MPNVPNLIAYHHYIIKKKLKMLGGTVATPCPYCGSALVVGNFPPISHEEQHQQQYQT
jgi:hypothetical protein